VETALTNLAIRDIRYFIPVSRRRSMQKILIEDAPFLCATLSARDGSIYDRSIRPIAPVRLRDDKYYRVTTKYKSD